MGVEWEGRKEWLGWRSPAVPLSASASASLLRLSLAAASRLRCTHCVINPRLCATTAGR